MSQPTTSNPNQQVTAPTPEQLLGSLPEVLTQLNDDESDDDFSYDSDSSCGSFDWLDGPDDDSCPGLIRRKQIFDDSDDEDDFKTEKGELNYQFFGMPTPGSSSNPTATRPNTPTPMDNPAPPTQTVTVPAVPNPTADDRSVLDLVSALRGIEEKEKEGMVSDTVARAAATSVNVPKYQGAKRKILNDFIEALRRESPKYDDLLKPTDQIPVSFRLGNDSVARQHIEQVWVLISGPDNKNAKVNLVNKMLIDWIGNMKKQKGEGKFHSPASINTMVRRFLSATKSHFDWHITQADFSFDGGYNGFFRDLCATRLEEDVSICDNIMKHFYKTSNLFTYIPLCFSQPTDSAILLAASLLRMQRKLIYLFLTRTIPGSTK